MCGVCVCARIVRETMGVEHQRESRLGQQLLWAISCYSGKNKTVECVLSMLALNNAAFSMIYTAYT